MPDILFYAAQAERYAHKAQLWAMVSLLSGLLALVSLWLWPPWGKED